MGEYAGNACWVVYLSEVGCPSVWYPSVLPLFHGTFCVFWGVLCGFSIVGRVCFYGIFLPWASSAADIAFCTRLSLLRVICEYGFLLCLFLCHNVHYMGRKSHIHRHLCTLCIIIFTAESCTLIINAYRKTTQHVPFRILITSSNQPQVFSIYCGFSSALNSPYLSMFFRNVASERRI